MDLLNHVDFLVLISIVDGLDACSKLTTHSEVLDCSFVVPSQVSACPIHFVGILPKQRLVHVSLGYIRLATSTKTWDWLSKGVLLLCFALLDFPSKVHH
jgi:hypothetical protein